MHDHLLTEKLTLHVKVKNAEDLLSNYTYDDDNINPDLSDYLIEKAEHIYPLPVKENFIINIHTKDTKLRLSDITRRIHRHFHDEYDIAKRKLQYNTRLALTLFVLGMTMMLLYFLAEHFVGNFFLTKILEVSTWVFIWGAVEVFIIDRHDLRNECALLRRLAFAEVIITADNRTSAPVYIG
ncbi:MAG: hypothetical protein IJ295_02850 [Clostridia bacterium]|nr:hypothetical protein [Clostridia bacterium]